MTLHDYEHMEINGVNTSVLEDKMANEIREADKLLGQVLISLDAYLKGNAQESILEDSAQEIEKHLEKHLAFNPLKETRK